MQFVVVGISYQEADETLRASLVVPDSKKISLYEELSSNQVVQSVLVSTCNRTEIYAYCEDRDLDLLYKIFDREASGNIRDRLYTKKGRDACLHLFEVCGGYRSMIPGEDQIEGQLQESYRFACDMGACQKAMHQIFQSCFRCIKKLKTTYQFNSFPMSIPYITMQYIKRMHHLRDSHILIIGSGAMAELMVTYMKEEAVASITLCNRNMEKAKRLLSDGRMRLIDFSQRYQTIEQYDIVISATASPHKILTAQQYPITANPQLLVDLAMPRDIDEELSARGHQIFSIDDVANIQDSSRTKRLHLLEQGRGALEVEVDTLMNTLEHEEVDEVLSSLHQLSEDMAATTLSMILRKVTLAHHETMIIEKILKANFHRMVKEPMRALTKANTQQDTLCAMIKQLYDLEDN